MDDGDCGYVQKDERNRRFQTDNFKKRTNVVETQKRDEQIAKREQQRIGVKSEDSCDSDDNKKKGKKGKETDKMSKEEKQKLYEKDMDDCQKAQKGKQKRKI